MNRILQIIVRSVMPLAAAALCVCLAAEARARDVWQQNISMLVTTDGKPDGSAELFDSADYQQMLLLLDGRPKSFVLSLADGGVYGFPRDSVLTNPEGNAVLGIFKMEYVSDLEKKDANLSFAWDGHAIELAPLPQLIGPTTLPRLLELKPSYAHASEVYKPDPAKIVMLKSVTTDTEIRVYFGTWCLLCKKLVPSVIRTVGATENPKIRVTYVGVDEDLTAPAGDIKKDHITKTPTIVVLQNGIEKGRIEEKAETSVEGDLAAILAVKP